MRSKSVNILSSILVLVFLIGSTRSQDPVETIRIESDLVDLKVSVLGFLSDADGVIRELAGTGALDGVECYYGDHTPEQTNRFVGLCRELGLLSTGGSDYHGPPVRSAVLGLPPVPVAAYQALLARAGRGPAGPPDAGGTGT